MGKAKRIAKNKATKNANATKPVVAAPEIDKKRYLQQKYEKALMESYNEGKQDGINFASTYFITLMVKILNSEFKFGSVRIQRVIDEMQKLTEEVGDGKLSFETLVDYCEKLGIKIEGM